MKTCLLSASCGLWLLLGIAPSPVPASRPLQQDTPAKQDAKDAGTSAKNAAQKTGSATKKETKKAVDGSDASKKPETTPSQDTERGIIDERCDEENWECHKGAIA